MSGATDSAAPVSRAENRNRSNRSSKASRQSGFGHTAGPWRRSSAVGSNKPPFRNGRRPPPRAAAERSAAARVKGPKHRGGRAALGEGRRAVRARAGRGGGNPRAPPSHPPLPPQKKE